MDRTRNRESLAGPFPRGEGRCSIRHTSRRCCERSACRSTAVSHLPRRALRSPDALDSGGMEATRRPSWSGFVPARTRVRSCAARSCSDRSRSSGRSGPTQRRRASSRRAGRDGSRTSPSSTVTAPASAPSGARTTGASCCRSTRTSWTSPSSRRATSRARARPWPAGPRQLLATPTTACARSCRARSRSVCARCTGASARA